MVHEKQKSQKLKKMIPELDIDKSVYKNNVFISFVIENSCYDGN